MISTCSATSVDSLEYENTKLKAELKRQRKTIVKKKKKKKKSETFAEVKILLRIWMKRLITALGIVAVSKSLVLSKLIHLWILLPNPPDEYINSLQKHEL